MHRRLSLYLITLIALFSVSFHSLSNTQSAEQHIAKQENLIYMQTDTGLVVIELSESLAPRHVERFKALIDEGFYTGLDFYRVIDGFVAQAGDLNEEKSSKHKKALPAEFTRALHQGSDFYTVQSPEFFAEQTGFIQGFAAGRSLTDKQEWLLHCPGAVGMARSNEADSASTEFYIVIGQAPRQLDRNMTVFAQVIYGLENIQKMHRGDRNINSGVISEDEKRSKILNVSMGNTIDKSKRMLFVRDTVHSANFQKRLNEARTLSNEFYHHKGSGNVDVCYYRPLYSLVDERLVKRLSASINIVDNHIPHRGIHC